MKDIYLKISSLTFMLFISLVCIGNLYQIPKQPIQGNILNGERTRAIEALYDDNSILSEWSKNLWAMLDYVLLDEGMTGVVIGTDGWLFSQEEYELPVESRLAGNIVFIEDTAKTLQRLNIALKIMLIPEKAEIYSHLSPKQQLRGEQLRLRVTRSLDAIQVKYLDLFSVFSSHSDNSELYLKTDTHWSPVGAKVAATTLANQLLSKGDTPYLSQLTETQEFRGDLLNFIPVYPYFKSLGPSPDSLPIYRTAPEANNEDALFGDQPLPELVLVGTSYSANPNWNFPGFLREAASQDLIDMSVAGEGPFKPMLHVLNDTSLLEGGVKTIIWEIPIRYFESQQFYMSMQGDHS
ncbi:alginate O-acetyltransferase AlgX-related protein [Vibrio ponticus]|nr:hypothetical protein [Vibrio ponticus]